MNFIWSSLLAPEIFVENKLPPKGMKYHSYFVSTQWLWDEILEGMEEKNEEKVEGKLKDIVGDKME